MSKEETLEIRSPNVDLTVLVPAINEAENLRFLLPGLHRLLKELPISYEIIVVDSASSDDTAQVARDNGARVLHQTLKGYGGALISGLRAAQGEYVLTMDADLSHEPNFILKLWRHRHRADIVVASRYVRGGVAYTQTSRKVMSRLLNLVFSKGLSLNIRDMSSGFRLYRASVLDDLELKGRGFEILEEILVRAHAEGWTITELPFTYFPRNEGSSHAKIFRVGWDLTRMFCRLWCLRNSIGSADYDERAFYSAIPLQRWWHRRRHRIITGYGRAARRVLDIGCGSSIILQSLNSAIGIDVDLKKLRYMRRYELPLVNASIFAIPFASGVFDCVICSEVIEHVPADAKIFQELDRVLAPGGLLVLGTPDYSTWTWPAIERLYKWIMPGGYADEHISQYSRAGLQSLLGTMGYRLVAAKYVFKSELIIIGMKGNHAFREGALREYLPRRGPAAGGVRTT